MSSVPDPGIPEAPGPSRGLYQPWTQTLLILLVTAAAVYVGRRPAGAGQKMRKSL